VRTDELIVELARSAAPVRPLPRPSVRLMRWVAAMMPLTALTAIVIGLRADVVTVMFEPAFLAIAAVTLGTALLAAASALILSVPGIERSLLQRVIPLVSGGLWVVALCVLLTTGGGALERLLRFPLHWACVIQIAALSVVPGFVLFAMVRGAAPLRRAWSGALATLAAVGLSAAATQFICPLDDPAHQLVGHVLPVAALSVLGAFVGHRYLNWLDASDAPQKMRATD
jgi:hypothetical protein